MRQGDKFQNSFFKYDYYEIKARGLQLSFNIFPIVINLGFNKNKLYKTLGY